MNINFKGYKVLHFITLLLLFYSVSTAQEICNDSVVEKRYWNSKWYSFEALTVANLQDGGMITAFGTYGKLGYEEIPTNGYTLMKFDASANAMWSKQWRIEEGNIINRSLKELGNGDILITGMLRRNEFNRTAFYTFLGRMDANGNFKWIRYYQGYTTTFLLNSLVENSNGNLLIPIRKDTYDLILVSLNPLGEVNWSSIYYFNDLPEFTGTNTFALHSISDTSLYVFRSTESHIDQFGLHSKSSIYALKIQSKTGELLQSKQFLFPGKGVASGRKVAFYNNHFEIWGQGVSDSLSFIFNLSLEKDLTLRRSEKIRGPNVFVNNYLSISVSSQTGDATGMFLLPGSKQNAYYFSIGNDLNYLYHRKMTLRSGIEQIQFLERNNGRMNFLSSYRNAVEPNFTITDFSQDFLTGTNCSGEDTAAIFVQRDTLLFSARNPAIPQSSYNLQAIPDDFKLSETEYPMQEETICQETSICDSIKIKGPETVCDIQQPQLYVAEMRKDCRKKIDWNIDTSAVESVNPVDNTTIRIIFKKDWQGYLSASIKSCGINDSLKIEIPKRKPAVYLGKDTTLCRDQITIRAGKGYTNYTWQDGSQADTLNVTAKGEYRVTVIDSCGRQSSDTIKVSAVNLSFSAGADQTICLYDSTQLSATGGFYNYTWYPDSSLIKNDRQNVIAFPGVTMRYRVTADKFPGCTVMDSMTVQIDHCPQEIFFPNAFSPNSDGLNDVFNPLITGKVSQYKFTVYNRYGQPIFQTSNPAKGWDGRYRNEPQQTGMYIWTCEYKFRGAPSKHVKGKITIIR